MTFKVASSPHQHTKRRTSDVMRFVLLCAIPGLLVQTWYFGWGTLFQLALATVTAVLAEVAVLSLRKRNFEQAIGDYSAILTAFLLAISIPPLAPWWLIVVGSLFAIVIVKQLYGGLGFNLFNPAMAAYVMLLISFPLQMTSWMPPSHLLEQPLSVLDTFYCIFTGFSADGYSLEQIQSDIDGITMATPLDQVKTDLTLGLTYSESLQNGIFSHGLGIGWFAVNIAYLFGGLVLLKSKVIYMQIPAGMLLSLLLISSVFHLSDPDQYASPLFHLFSGATMLGAFFIATDPVTAATSKQGRWLFGALIGAWVYLIRTFGGYPDAVAFAVVLMNMTVPLIDYYLTPRVYGQRSRK